MRAIIFLSLLFGMQTGHAQIKASPKDKGNIVCSMDDFQGTLNGVLQSTMGPDVSLFVLKPLGNTQMVTGHLEGGSIDKYDRIYLVKRMGSSGSCGAGLNRYKVTLKNGDPSPFNPDQGGDR